MHTEASMHASALEAEENGKAGWYVSLGRLRKGVERTRPEGGPLRVWVGAVITDPVAERFCLDEFLEDFLCGGLVRHGGRKVAGALPPI